MPDIWSENFYDTFGRVEEEDEEEEEEGGELFSAQPENEFDIESTLKSLTEGDLPELSKDTMANLLGYTTSRFYYTDEGRVDKENGMERLCILVTNESFENIALETVERDSPLCGNLICNLYKLAHRDDFDCLKMHDPAPLAFVVSRLWKLIALRLTRKEILRGNFASLKYKLSD